MAPVMKDERNVVSNQQWIQGLKRQVSRPGQGQGLEATRTTT